MAPLLTELLLEVASLFSNLFLTSTGSIKINWLSRLSSTSFCIRRVSSKLTSSSRRMGLLMPVRVRRTPLRYLRSALKRKSNKQDGLLLGGMEMKRIVKRLMSVLVVIASSLLCAGAVSGQAISEAYCKQIEVSVVQPLHP